MSRHAWIAAVLVALTAGAEPPSQEGKAPAESLSPSSAGASPSHTEPCSSCWQQMAPAGGWCPYPGGLLHWWHPDWFPHAGAPDLYHRKQLPGFKWPPYPHYYIWAPRH